MIFSETNKEIAPALVKAWGSIKNPKHNAKVKVFSKKNNSSYTFEYTDLGGIFDEAKKAMKDNGITIMQNAYTETREGTRMVSVETMLLHESGEWVKSQPMQYPSTGNMQDMGGMITYMKRYSLSAMLGIATEKDDDVNGAMGNTYEDAGQGQQTRPQAVPSKLTDRQKNNIDRLLREVAEKYNAEKGQVYDRMKRELQTGKELEAFTRNEASRAIDYLTDLTRNHA